MKAVFAVDDDTHSEAMSKHDTFEEALAEIKRLATLPWDSEPNMAPCANWRNCGRRYDIVEFEMSSNERWRERSRTPILEVNADGVFWFVPPECTSYADVTGSAIPGKDGRDRLPPQVISTVFELIRRDDVRSVSCPFNDVRVWRGLVTEQLRRSKKTGLPPQEAFTLCGADGGMCEVPFEEWGGHVHVPYEGMCAGDLVLLPLWRKFFAEDAEETGRLSTAAHLCCHHLLTPRDFGEVGFATRTPVGDWVLYQSKTPYVPCDPLDRRKVLNSP